MDTELKRMLFIKGRKTPPNVLIAAAECAPLSKTGGLADMAGALPKYLKNLGFDARVITPYHACVRQKYADKAEYIGYVYVDLGWRHEYAGLLKLELDGVIVYLIDSEYYFGGAIYRGGQPEVEQYAFFQRAVLECLHLLDFTPEVLHCNDWHTAFLPFLIKTQYQGRPEGALKTVLTIHNIAFQGWMPYDTAADLLGVGWEYLNEGCVGHWGCANMLKTGCLFADKVNTVSPSYANEIRTIEFGEKLEYVLNCRGGDVSGILNGIDTEVFDPASDPNILYHFDAERPEDKVKNKEALIGELGLEIAPETPLIAMVTRMTGQKGFDLVLEAMEGLMQRDVGFVLLGSGEQRYEEAMRSCERRWPGRVCAYIGYSEDLARRIYASADFFLMPSGFEPCGLGQIIAMRYGALPIVHEVGGLKDTVTPYDSATGEGTGFSFWDFHAGVMLNIINYALDVYRDKAVMGKLIRSAMTKDLSLGLCAEAYGELYVSLLWGVNGGLRHVPHSEDFRKPFGAVKCGAAVTLRLETEDYDGGAELIANGAAYPMERGADGYFTVEYTAPAEPQLVWYSFRLSNGALFGPAGVGTGDMQSWQMTVYDPAFQTPAWAEGTFMYQIFPDRFAPGGRAFDEGVRYHRILGRHIEIHRNWNEPAKYRASTRPDYYPDDFFGGTLRGITDMLPELKKMGVGCIYLNPIFEADSNHRYNTADYNKIDPMLGDEGEFRALCAEAKAYGIHVILDGVFSHTGDDSVYFNRPGNYESPGAYQGKESPYYNWFDFRSFPNEYRSWWGFDSLPEVNETNPDWQDFIITGENAVMKNWLRRGANGWRLDVADELPDEVIDRMRESVKETDPEALLIGEVWEDATNKVSYGALRRYALGQGLDSVMNYPFRVAMLDFALGWSGAEALRDFFVKQKLNYPAPMYRCLMNLLGSHDTARLRTVLGAGHHGDGLSREDQAAFTLTEEQNLRGRALQRLCAAVQFVLPGMPCVYYGDEEGMTGWRDPFCREPYAAAPAEESLREFYTELAAKRSGSDALRQGDAAFAAWGPDVVGILRWVEEEAILTVVNRGGEAVKFQPSAEDFLAMTAEETDWLGELPEIEVGPMDFVMLEV